MKKEQTSYGFYGWNEFNQNRRELLDAYFSSKTKNINRPVRVEHGVAAEAKLREWLSKTLPKKFGVTSGYVIPDLIAREYQLNHFDVIIYDALNAPVLWVDSTEDSSEGGKRRAIPSQYGKHKGRTSEYKLICEFSFGIDAAQIWAIGKKHKVVRTRSLLNYWATSELGVSQVWLSRKLGFSQAAVSLSVARGRQIVIPKN